MLQHHKAPALRVLCTLNENMASCMHCYGTCATTYEHKGKCRENTDHFPRCIAAQDCKCPSADIRASSKAGTLQCGISLATVLSF